MNATTRTDLEILLGAALLPLKASIDQEIGHLSQNFASLTPSSSGITPSGEELVSLIKISDSALHDSSVALAEAFLQGIRGRGFRSLSDVPQADQAWFEDHALYLLDRQIRRLELEGLPYILHKHYARQRLGPAWSSGRKFRRSFDCVRSLEAVRDYFRAELRVKGVHASSQEAPDILEALELKPNFLGFGLNLNYILNWLRSRWTRKL